MAMTNQERARKQAERIAAQARRAVGKGLQAGVIFLTARVKETLNVPAPKRAVRGPAEPGKKKGPIRYYVATKAATPGAPMRKLSGNAQQHVTYQVKPPGFMGEQIAEVGTTAKSEKGFNYPEYHERPGIGRGSGKHRWLYPTFHEWRGALRLIIGRAFTSRMRSRD